MNHVTLPTYYQYYNSLVPAALQVDQNSLFGYINFRQIRDKTIKRGYFPKIICYFIEITIHFTISNNS